MDGSHFVRFISTNLREQSNYEAQPLQTLLGRASLVSALDSKAADSAQMGALSCDATPFGSSSRRMEQSVKTLVIQPNPRKPSSDAATRGVSNELCVICGDNSTGNHYGVVSCNGCKGFFRRTCWKNQRYICRFSDNCVVDKNRRNACRYCRFQKCLKAGMRREAIQNERDSIGCAPKTKQATKNSRKRPSTPEEETDDDDDDGNEETVESPSTSSDMARKKRKSELLNELLQLEARCNLHCVELLSKNAPSLSAAAAVEIPADLACPNVKFYRGLREASVDDLLDSWRTVLTLMVEWAKGVKPFPDLTTEDKMSLLRNYAAQHLCLLPTYKTADDSMICLINGCYISRGTDLPDVNNVINRSLDELVVPMRRLGMTEAEFVFMKILAFMNPDTNGLRSDTRPLVRHTREQAIQSLYDYEHKHFATSAAKRFGTLLLLLPQIKEIAQLLVENILFAKVFGLANIDQLLEELTLTGTDNSSNF